MPSPTGLYGVGFELGYDPAIVNVTGKNMTSGHVMQFSQGNAAPIVNTTDSLPDADGLFRVDSVGGDVQETGSGRVATITLECVNAGSTTLTLADSSTGGGDSVGVLYISGGQGGHYTVDQEVEATIGCGGGPTPTPASATPTAPPGSQTPNATPVSATPTGSPGSGTPTGSPGAGTPTPTPTPTSGSPTPITTTPGQTLAWGDSDCDGEITTRDNQALLRWVLSQEPLGQTEPCPDLGTFVGAHAWGDWDCDMAITTRDNQLLLRVTLSQAALSQVEPCPNPGDAVQVPT